MQTVQFHYRNVRAAFYLSEFNSLTVLLECNNKTNNRRHEKNVKVTFFMSNRICDTSYGLYFFNCLYKTNVFG